jgi:carbon-monoxide dehydrogenase medium subunit
MPIKARTVEAALRGKRIDSAAIKQAAQLAAEEAQPQADLRGSEEYKRDLVRVLATRALHRALERARGGQ